MGRDAKIMDDLRGLDNEAFYKKVLPQLEQLEVVRQAKLAVYLFRRRIAIPLAGVLTPVCLFLDFLILRMQSGSDDSGTGVTIAVLGGLYWWVTQPKRQYALAYKKDILPQIARLFGNLVYTADGKIPMTELKLSKIIPSHDRYTSEDHFTGTYKGIKITLSEIHLESRRRSGKRTTYVTEFKGLAVLIGMPREKFYGHTLLLQDKNRIGKWFTEKSHKLNRADLVDPEFEKAFDVYTNDQVEARYLIDPSMIENLKKMRDGYKAREFTTAYFKNQVLVLLPSSRNYFEPADINVKATHPETIIDMKEELGLVLNLVDHLEIYDAVSIHAANQAGIDTAEPVINRVEKLIPGMP